MRYDELGLVQHLYPVDFDKILYDTAPGQHFNRDAFYTRKGLLKYSYE